MRRESLREQVRAAARELGGQGAAFNFGDLSDALGIKDRQAEKRLHYAVGDLIKAGDVKRLGSGLVYAARPEGAPGKQEVMWNYFRIRGRAEVQELAEIAGTTVNYAGQYLRLLARRGLARLESPLRTPLIDRVYRFTGAQAEAPRNEDKNEYLRRRRQRLKEALSKIDAAWAAIAEARMAVSGLEEG